MPKGSVYEEKNYKDEAPSYYLLDKMMFSVGPYKRKILKTGIGCGICPVIVMQGPLVHIATPACASTGKSAGKHMEGLVLVPDYSNIEVMKDKGTLFTIKPPWLSHFLGVIGFAPVPLPGV